MLLGNEITYDEVLSGNDNLKHSSKVSSPRHGFIIMTRITPIIKKARGPRAYTFYCQFICVHRYEEKKKEHSIL